MPTEATLHLARLAFTAFASSLSSTNPSARQAITTPKFAFAPFGQAVQENTHFDTCKYVVTTNDLRKHLNYERLTSSFSPMQVDDCDTDVRACDRDDNNDTQLFTVGAEAILAFNLWTEASLVNEATVRLPAANVEGPVLLEDSHLTPLVGDPAAPGYDQCIPDFKSLW
jgi:hypothetical protein